ncbi:Variant-specific surface protein, partial [Giardia duodenalis]
VLVVRLLQVGVTLLVNAALSLGVCTVYVALSVMPCDAARHALCGAQGYTRATEVRGLWGAQRYVRRLRGVVGGELPHTGEAAECSACQKGYYLNDADKTCKVCTGCATCETAADRCTSCPEGKYLKGNTCAENCGGNTYYPDPVSRKCISCSATADEGGIESCATCEYDSTKGKPKCLTCTDGTKTPRTALDGTSTCVAKTIVGCQRTDKELFMKDDTTCALCAATGSGNDEGTANCKTCTKTSGNKPVCDTCKDGYYLDSSKACQACTGENCATCTEAEPAKCASCKPGFFLKDASSGECISCNDTAQGGREGCSACSNTNTFKCTKCKANYNPSGEEANLTCTKVCEDPTACGGTAGSCGAIVVGGDGSMTYYCSQCGQQQLPRLWHMH